MIAQSSVKDLFAGLIFIAFGLAFGYASLTYDLGTAFRMGPGYFPLVLAGILVLFGVAILVQSFFAGPDDAPIERAPWLGLVLIMGALAFFGLTVRGLGLAPALFVTTFMSAFASKQTGVVGALVISALLVVVSMLIFIVGLGLPLQTVGPWLDF